MGLRILIVGGGIAGLTLAAELRRRDIEPTVVEKVPVYRDVGYVIGLWPMGRRVLDHLGLNHRFDDITVLQSAYVIHRDGGKILRRFEFAARLGEDSPRLLKRADLLNLLRAYDGGTEVRMGRTVDRIEHNEEVIRVRFDDGEAAEYDVVVGADGIGSGLRRLVAGEVPVRSTGLRLWSWWGPNTGPATGEAHEYWGSARFFACNPTTGPLACAAVLPTPDTQMTPAQLRERLAGIAGPDDGHLLDTLDGAQLERFDLDDLRMPSWVFGRAVLLGDAGAAFLPSAGVGASMAMESAQVLAEELAGVDAAGVPAALQRYASRRRSRVETIQNRSRWLAPIMVPKTRFGSALRNAFLRTVPQRMVLDEITRWKPITTTG